MREIETSERDKSESEEWEEEMIVTMNQWERVMRYERESDKKEKEIILRIDERGRVMREMRKKVNKESEIIVRTDKKKVLREIRENVKIERWGRKGWKRKRNEIDKRECEEKEWWEYEKMREIEKYERWE